MQHEAVRLRPSSMPLEITGSLLNRFQSKIDKSDTHGGCWRWTGADRGNGYGAFGLQGKVIDAHVLSWRLAQGGAPVPAGHLIQHACDNRWCVNPSCLSLGTKKSNYDDMVGKGRDNRARGEQMRNSVLTEELVREIRRLHVPGRFGPVRIARQLGLNRKTVDCVLCGETWRHVQ